jgi:tRNA(Ile)-lysidine synthase TilS/MesJ
MVGLSGGKDSYLLLEALADRKRHMPISFELQAVHVAIKNIGYQIDTEYMSALCQKLHVPFHLIEMEIELGSDAEKKMCFLCSWHRRKAIFNFAHDLSFNRLALGHHMDDAVQTLMMNMIYHGSISSLPVSLSMFDGRMQLIRPLLFLNEAEIVKYTQLRQYPESIKACPYDKATRRNDAKVLINSMVKMNPNALKNIFRSMSHICFEYLPDLNSPTYFERFGCNQ